MKRWSPCSRWVKVRLLLVVLLLLGLFATVVAQAYDLQIRQGPRMRQMAEEQYLKEIKIPSRRGSVLDRNLSPLALSVEVDSIFSNPRQILASHREPTLARLASILSLDRSGRARLRQTLASDRYFRWIKRRVSPKLAEQVRQEKLEGIFLTRETRRYYPNQGLGGMVVGFSNIDSRGIAGVELTLDGWLRGSPVELPGLRDAHGQPVYADGITDLPAAGHNVRLTIDRFIQFETERALAAVEYRAKTGWAAAVVMDPKTGDILAMANSPSFDPNRFAETEPDALRNRSVTDAFEPGSTMKIFSIAGALEAKAVRFEESFYCERGAWRVGKHVIHDTHHHQMLNVSDIIKKSSNIGTSKIAFRLGKEGLHRALHRFGFGQKTEIPLPGERSGVLRAPSRWANVTLANVSFGQGLTVTLLQLTRALSALANGGVLVKPRLVLEVRNPKGEIVEKNEPHSERVLRPEVAQRVLRAMVGVTEPGGTATKAALPHYQVAGKTGTAQKVDPATRRYSSKLWLAAFIGVVPASNPRLVIAVAVNEPTGRSYYGGEVAGPVFREIAASSLRYLGVEPDKQSPPPPLAKKGETQRQAQSPALDESAGMTISTPIEAAEPPIDALTVPGEDRVPLPDFTGMSLVEVLRAADEAGVAIELRGSGRAVGQSPGPGPVPRGTTCQVVLRPPG
jgi:cell division protein FtsI (penicillin-binding protein 3)